MYGWEKNISLEVEADSEAAARQVAEEAAKKLLANPVMEYFEVEVMTSATAQS